jgi:hypothetical protein
MFLGNALGRSSCIKERTHHDIISASYDLGQNHGGKASIGTKTHFLGIKTKFIIRDFHCHLDMY